MPLRGCNNYIDTLLRSFIIDLSITTIIIKSIGFINEKY